MGASDFNDYINSEQFKLDAERWWSNIPADRVQEMFYQGDWDEFWDAFSEWKTKNGR